MGNLLTGAEILEKLLPVLDITVYELANKCGYGRVQAFYDVQKGRTKNISSVMANKIIKAFPQVQLEWLLTGEGEMLKTGDIHVVGDSNFSNTGITGGDIIIGTDQEVQYLKKRNKELEAEVKKLKSEIKLLQNDKEVLHDFIAVLQNKK